MKTPIKVSIVGASGYSGAELFTILLRHKGVTVEKLFANSSAGKAVREVYPRFAHHVNAMYEPYALEAACSSDLVFVALPSGEAMNIVPELLQRGKRVIDLGGDFRLRDATVYEQYYKHRHTSASLLTESVYGLPEWNRERIKTAKLVANPGCYPTSATLPLLPLLKHGLIRPDGISISSLSGVSGAGRSASVDLSFAEVNESVKAYKVGVHQHIPEIKQTLEQTTAQSVRITFVPHLLPITRGIYTSIYAQLSRPLTEEEVIDAYNAYYAREPFVRFSSTAIPEIKNVAYTNYIDIGFRLYPENHQIIVLSALDNLVKGAAGQAVQNMNLMFGFDETEGLV
ncbi:MAG TPA: N-acetyl-gamma-glutamyl-phosphate reductase [Bacteroidota bacterium]|nr:N-acetyl-gamma-glutamyl-phosphate reductase [Bacteroidota bacterium]